MEDKNNKEPLRLWYPELNSAQITMLRRDFKRRELETRADESNLCLRFALKAAKDASNNDNFPVIKTLINHAKAAELRLK